MRDASGSQMAGDVYRGIPDWLGGPVSQGVLRAPMVSRAFPTDVEDIAAAEAEAIVRLCTLLHDRGHQVSAPVLILCDNVAVVHALRKGRAHHQEVNRWLHQRGLLAGRRVQYIRSARNTLPDRLSREFDRASDWTLTDHYYAKFDRWRRARGYPAPTVDGMASAENKRCAAFCSKYEDIGSRGSFFHADLSGDVVWVNPPFRDIHSVICGSSRPLATCWCPSGGGSRGGHGWRR